MSNGNFLHQILAVEPDLVQQARNIMEECVNTFTKKAEHFDGVKKIYSPNNDNEEKVPPDIKEIVTTVSEKLDYASVAVIKAIDATLSKEETNASGLAKADLVIGKKTVTLSATSLLALEKKLVGIRDEYKTIPTLDPARTWTKENQTGRDFFVAPIETKYRVVKKQRPLIMAPATDKHPAQVQLVTDEEQVGKYETTYTSGKFTPGEKSEILGRIDDLILNVKMAREKANQTEVKQVKLGEEIFNYIHG